MTIIKIDALQSGQHPIESQSGRTSCWLDGWIAVPDHLEAKVWDTLGWCDLDIWDGVLVGITPTNRPEPEPEPETVPSYEERLFALESAMLSMMGVSSNV